MAPGFAVPASSAPLRTPSRRNARPRTPSLDTVEKLSTFLEVPIDRLLKTPFAKLVSVEVGDEERFARVEAKIRKPSNWRTFRTANGSFKRASAG